MVEARLSTLQPVMQKTMERRDVVAHRPDLASGALREIAIDLESCGAVRFEVKVSIYSVT